MSALCEACQSRPIELVEQIDPPSVAYSLCAPCYHRLVHRSLRPLEYFNLVALHGHNGELHDDFYGDDGEACAAEEEVVADTRLAFPTLASLAGNAGRLVDFALVKWQYPPAVTVYLAALSPALVLHVLNQRVSWNTELLPRCLDIAARALGPQAQAWVHEQFRGYTGPDRLLFAEAIACCLPPVEAEALILSELSKLNEKALTQSIRCLCYLAGPEPLDWLEQHCHSILWVSTSYGVAAALLGMTWARVQHWLQLGRPLSLIALDAVANCDMSLNTAKQYCWFRKQPVRLLEPAPVVEMEQVLTAYLAQDRVPRTKYAVNFILTHWKHILKPEQPSS